MIILYAKEEVNIFNTSNSFTSISSSNTSSNTSSLIYRDSILIKLFAI